MSVMEDVYPSRIEAKPQILERKDPVVYSEDWSGAPISEDQIRSYDQNGYLVIPEMFSINEVDALFRELRRLSALDEIKQAKESITEPDSGQVRSIFAVHELSDVYNAMARDRRLLDIARFLLGGDVYIHQSRVNFKPGFRGKEFYWHSDFETWHMEDGMPRMRAVSASIALTENFEFNGPLMLIPGSHRKYVACVGKTPEDHYKSSLKKQEFGVPDDDSLAQLAESGGIDVPKGKPGSVTFFECNTMHGSNGNITPFPRSNAFFVYNSVENHVVDPFCGAAPRPEFIAARKKFETLTPTEPDYASMVSRNQKQSR